MTVDDALETADKLKQLKKGGYNLLIGADAAIDLADEVRRLRASIKGLCPQCQSDTGLKYPRGMGVYCEDCGWPEEDFDKPEAPHG